MPSTSFVKRSLKFSFSLTGNAVFEGSGTNVLTLEGLRATATLRSAGAAFAPSASLQIFGMSQSDMNALTFLAFDPRGLNRNTVRVEADGRVAFVGQIIQAGPEYGAMPDVYLQVEALTGYIEQISPADVCSINGTASIVDVMQRLADAYGVKLENNGVTGTTSCTYLPSSLGEQLRTYAEHANIDLYRDADVIAITPKGQPRKVQLVNLTPTTGLIGYPTIDARGIQVRCLYNPGLRFGGSMHVESDSTGVLDRLFPRKANGDWWIYALDHYLQSETPGGAWESNLGCSAFRQGGT